MLDSLLTLSKAGALWMLGFFVVCVVVDRGLSALTGHPEVIFLLLAFCIALAFVVTGTYTLAKLAIHRLRGPNASAR